MYQRILFIIGIIVVVGLGYAGVRWLGNGAAPEAPPTQQVGQYPNQTTVAVETPPAVPVPDIVKEYRALFSRLLAEHIAFTPVRTTAEAGGDLYALYTEDIARAKEFYPNATNFLIEVAFVDLDDDSAAEALVNVALPGYCGTAGCPLDIYKKASGKWSLIASFVSQGEVGMANVITNGYRDLFLSLPSEEGLQQVFRFVWDEGGYQQREVVATWDGATFR